MAMTDMSRFDTSGAISIATICAVTASPPGITARPRIAIREAAVMRRMPGARPGRGMDTGTIAITSIGGIGETTAARIGMTVGGTTGGTTVAIGDRIATIAGSGAICAKAVAREIGGLLDREQAVGIRSRRPFRCGGRKLDPIAPSSRVQGMQTVETRPETKRKPGREPRPAWMALVDRVSVGLAVLVWSAATIQIAPLLGQAGVRAWLPGLLGALVGFLLADFVSGLVHWLADRYFDPRTPILGPALIAPFREHHEDALAMTRHDFFEVSGNNALVTLPLALGLIVFFPTPETGTPISAHPVALSALAAGVLSFGFFVITTNQFHCWAHARRRPALVTRLQRAGLVLSPERHRAHHRKAHDCGYCVTSGWMNPVLDGIGFFKALERLIARTAQIFRFLAGPLRLLAGRRPPRRTEGS
jgi:hypothetical protein